MLLQIFSSPFSPPKGKPAQHHLLLLRRMCSRLRYWLCPSFLSAHLDVKAGFKASTLRVIDSRIHILALIAERRICQIAYFWCCLKGASGCKLPGVRPGYLVKRINTPGHCKAGLHRASSNLYLKPAISPRGDVMVGDDGAPAVRYARSIRAAATEEKEVPASPG